MKKTIFTGAGVAIITPMNEDGSINFDKLGELIEFNIENRNPLNCRESPKFSQYFNTLWKELGVDE